MRGGIGASESVWLAGCSEEHRSQPSALLPRLCIEGIQPSRLNGLRGHQFRFDGRLLPESTQAADRDMAQADSEDREDEPTGPDGEHVVEGQPDRRPRADDPAGGSEQGHIVVLPEGQGRVPDLAQQP